MNLNRGNETRSSDRAMPTSTDLVTVIGLVTRNEARTDRAAQMPHRREKQTGLEKGSRAERRSADRTHGVAMKPDVIKPDVIKPDVIKPDVIKPDVIRRGPKTHVVRT